MLGEEPNHAPCTGGTAVANGWWRFPIGVITKLRRMMAATAYRAAVTQVCRVEVVMRGGWLGVFPATPAPCGAMAVSMSVPPGYIDKYFSHNGC
jgi:hypothetical protein